MADTSDPPIVITGGSVSLEFDINTLPGSGGRHSHANKKIQHVTVERNGTKLYDADTPDGRVKVTITYGNGNSTP